MPRLFMLFSFLCVACGIAPQPESNRTVVAFEIPLPTVEDKASFLELLGKAAKAHGYHVDAATSTELQQMSEVSPITMNATVWEGNDEHRVASAMDFQDHIGRVWISFAKGEDPRRYARFRDALMLQIRKVWPGTASLPIMPTGAIPLIDDLIRTPAGYEVNPSAEAKYQLEIQ